MSQQKKQTNYIIREDLANAILRYLGSRPVAEAGDMFYALRQIQPLAEPIENVLPEGAEVVEVTELKQGASNG
jgi:hypothetical protein